MEKRAITTGHLRARRVLSVSESGIHTDSWCKSQSKASRCLQLEPFHSLFFLSLHPLARCYWAVWSHRRTDAVRVWQEADEMRCDSSALPPLDGKCQGARQHMRMMWRVGKRSLSPVSVVSDPIYVSIMPLWFWQYCNIDSMLNIQQFIWSFRALKPRG